MFDAFEELFNKVSVQVKLGLGRSFKSGQVSFLHLYLPKMNRAESYRHMKDQSL